MRITINVKRLIDIFSEGIKLVKKQERLIKNQNILLSIDDDVIVHQQNKINLYKERINTIKKHLPQDVLEQLESEGL